MSRPYSPYSGNRGTYSDARFQPEPVQDEADYQQEYEDYPEYEYPADYHEHLDRRWIWVAGVAGLVLMVAVICTGVILGGGDSGSVSATASSSAATSSAATTTASAPPVATSVPPRANTPALPPETVTTVTPAPSASADPTPAPTEVPVAPADPAAAARTITYQVTGNRQLIDLITVIYTDQQGALQTDLNVALPWTKTITLNPGVALSSVTATSMGGQLNCSITDVNGAPVVTQANNTMIATCTN